MADGTGTRDHSFCCADPEQREQFLKVVAYAASMFDEIIFDDMFMYNCRGEYRPEGQGEPRVDRIPPGRVGGYRCNDGKDRKGCQTEYHARP